MLQFIYKKFCNTFITHICKIYQSKINQSYNTIFFLFGLEQVR